MNIPKVSVLLPVYNGEKYLKEAIDSILSQTFIDFEFIIINDGSTDKTEKIIKSYSDDRIVYYKNEKNKGLVYTLNRGIDLARGEYIARMDGDDISLPKRFEKQIEFMESNKAIGLCSTNVISINFEGTIISKSWWFDDLVPLEWKLLWENPIAHPSVMIRKKVLIENDLKYRESVSVSQDYDLWTRLCLYVRIARLNDVLLFYRKTDESAFHSNIEIALSNSLESNLKLLKVLTGESSPAFHKYLFVFYKGKTEFVEVDDLNNWINKLISTLGEKWNWDNKQLKVVKADSKKRVFNYYSKLDKTVLVKNVFRLWKMGFIFYIRMFYLFMKFIYRRIRKILLG